MIELLIGSLSVTYLMIVWFQSSAFIEYVKLFRINKLSKFLNRYIVEQNQEKTPFANFIEWLNYNWHDSFFVKLVSCPICISFWLTLPFSLYYSWVLWLPMSFISTFLYFWLANLMKRLHQ